MKTFQVSLKTLVAVLTLGLTSAFAAPATDPAAAPTKSSFQLIAFRSKEADKVNLILTKSNDKRLWVTLRDTKGQVVFQETISKKSDRYLKKFDLAALGDGTYRIEVTDGEVTSRKEVTLSTEQPARQIALN
jgi:hypothetical protein